MAIENHPSVRQLVRRTLDAPADAREALPTLLDALNDADPTVRVGVAWAICAVAAATPEAAPEIVRELDGRHGHTAAMAAGWIRRELDVDGTDVDAPATHGVDGRPETGRSEEGRSEEARSGEGQSEAGQSGAERGEAGSSEVSDGEANQSETTRPEAIRSQTARSEASQTSEPETEGSTPSSGPIRERPDEVVQSGQFTIELDRTPLDSLEIVERVASDRHSWTYAGIASVDARRHAVLVRTYRPPQGARLSTFSGAFEDVLADWDGVDDHEHVLTVHAYGRRPHPWIVTGYAPRTLRSVGRLSVPAALQVGLDAATGLGHAHERGVTHRSLDPRSVALDSEDGRPIGYLANFGVVDPFRTVNGPLPLDSRYAAPELFDSEFGAVDWLTDVYHLGAVLYTAFTGRPPYEESLVARGGPAGLTYDPPSSVVDGVPVAADRIVAKAMATHKIARYETADEFARDIQSALAEVEDQA